jgi:hypothetical protein
MGGGTGSVNQITTKGHQMATAPSHSSIEDIKVERFAPAITAMIPDDAWIKNLPETTLPEQPKPGVRAKVLQTAETLVNGDRNKQYGPPDSDFRRTANFWQEYLKGVVEARGELRLEPHDVGVMMALLKISRITWSPGKADSWVDLAGYAACAADCVEIEQGLTGWPG